MFYFVGRKGLQTGGRRSISSRITIKLCIFGTPVCIHYAAEGGLSWSKL